MAKKKYKYGWIKWDKDGDFVEGKHDVFGKATLELVGGSFETSKGDLVPFCHERIFFSNIEDDDEGIFEGNIEGYFNRQSY